MKPILVFLSIMILETANALAQEKYQARFTPAFQTLYCGVVNLAQFNIDDVTQPRRVVKFHAIATGAQLDYDDFGRVLILPKSKDLVITVYGSMKDQIYRIGEIKGRCVEPPLNDEAFRMNFPNPDKPLEHIKNYSINGRSVKADSALTVGYQGMAELVSEQGTMIALQVVRINGSHMSILPWWDCDIRSSDAEIRRDSKQVYIIKPMKDKHQCELEIYFKGTKILREVLVVRKEK